MQVYDIVAHWYEMRFIAWEHVVCTRSKNDTFRFEPVQKEDFMGAVVRFKRFFAPCKGLRAVGRPWATRFALRALDVGFPKETLNGWSSWYPAGVGSSEVCGRQWKSWTRCTKGLWLCLEEFFFFFLNGFFIEVVSSIMCIWFCCCSLKASLVAGANLHTSARMVLASDLEIWSAVVWCTQTKARGRAGGKTKMDPAEGAGGDEVFCLSF